MALVRYALGKEVSDILVQGHGGRLFNFIHLVPLRKLKEKNCEDRPLAASNAKEYSTLNTGLSHLRGAATANGLGALGLCSGFLLKGGCLVHKRASIKSCGGTSIFQMFRRRTRQPAIMSWSACLFSVNAAIRNPRKAGTRLVMILPKCLPEERPKLTR